MNSDKYEYIRQLVQEAYNCPPDLREAEKIATRFVGSMLDVSMDLQKADLNARMRRTGLKAIKAAVYMKNATATDKKPSDVMLNAQVDQDKLVIDEQNAYDEAEVAADYLRNLYNTLKEAHVHFRGISKARYE